MEGLRCTVVAPPGPLGISLQRSSARDPYITVVAIKSSSSLRTRVQVGDYIVSVDEQNVKSWTSKKLSDLLSSRSHSQQRRLELIRDFDKKLGRCFPPTVFTDAIYSKGIRLVHDVDSLVEQRDSTEPNLDGYFAHPPSFVNRLISIGSQRERYMYHSSNSTNCRRLPVLSSEESKMWMHGHAAISATQTYFPMEAVRLLGTITRTITEETSLTTDKYGPTCFMSPALPKGKKIPTLKSRHPKPKKMTAHQAKSEAKAEFVRSGVVDPVSSDLEHRAEQIRTNWNNIQARGTRRQGWDNTGGIHRTALNDPDYVTLDALLAWMERTTISDCHENSRHSLYNGLRSIPVDTKTVLKSLLELSDPRGLYDIPLILPYAVVHLEKKRVKHTKTPIPHNCGTENNQAIKKSKTTVVKRSFKVQIGVYANRLLPEVMTSHDLHIIMSALDRDSYRLVKPIHLPPMRSSDNPVFQSSLYPAVAMDSTILKNDEKGGKTNEHADVTITDSTRDESTISAFTVKGLLKLMENKGNDISNWNDIDKVISPMLKVNLMLHQIHGICWMVQMESLGGFGINSILWEEREFLDGSKYYYSPAVGQIRLTLGGHLGQPPVMKGGILADEMGLGKTIQVLGLILATLEELKSEDVDVDVDEGSHHMHATLIIVPPALVSQWIQEIRKVTGDALSVEFFDFKTLEFERKSQKQGSPNIVVTTYNALEKKSAASRILTSKSWGRVVLDEMQEIRSSTTFIAKNCEKLNCSRRWMLSGTPLFEGVNDFQGELCFLRLEPFCHGLDDGFFQFSILNHWHQNSRHGLETLRILSLLLLRRSKTMTICSSNLPLLGLKPLTVEFVPISQDKSERALYCFLEMLVSKELSTASNCEGELASSVLASRNLCLRLLREMCLSSVLLNGGLGATSQLQSLNNMLINSHRSESCHSESLEQSTSKVSLMSCDMAIRHLSQVQDDAKVPEDFVSFMSVGGGGGISQRARAHDSVEVQYNEAKENAEKARNECKIARTKRAKALWHLALERITTGSFQIGGNVVVPKIHCLWRWRFVVAKVIKGEQLRTSTLPELLTRGWRPSPNFVRRELFNLKPQFAWAHPFSVYLDRIPENVTTREIEESIIDSLQRDSVKLDKEKDDPAMQRVQIVPAVRVSDLASWRAVAQFLNEGDFKSVIQKSRSVDGVAVSSKEKIRHVEESISFTKSKLEEAVAENRVYPCTSNQQKETKAKKEYSKALCGLRILHHDQSCSGHIRLSRALGPCRSLQPQSCSTLFDSLSFSRMDQSAIIVKNEMIREQGEQAMKRLSMALHDNISKEVQTMSAFEALQALSNNEREKTSCPICLGNLGTMGDAEQSTIVAMTRCGHLFCEGCLEVYVRDRVSRGQSTACPNCRKVFELTRVVRVDPKYTADKDALEERRQQAKLLVQQASQMLQTSNGQLDAHMWEQLYLSIDLPVGSDTSSHGRFTAIPREVLAHIRWSTGMQVHCHQTEKPDNINNFSRSLSSKIRALLSDLPRDERSVVFSSSKRMVQHLLLVLEMTGFGCRALFTGQDVHESEVALKEWQSNSFDGGDQKIPYLVLIVQAGAAASGLTLTDARRIFLLEPFVRQEEEQQAYARCHRFGQQKEVFCKCYYTPVSVESRLLDWRKQASTPLENLQVEETKIVYSSFGTESNITVDDGEDEKATEKNQTKFLLGLKKSPNNYRYVEE